MTNDSPDRAGLALIASIAGTLALWYVVPFGDWFGWPLMLISTLAHELGHGLAALMVGSDFESLRVHLDGSGVAYSSGTRGRFAQAWISAGGLVGPSVAAAGMFAAGRRPRVARATLGAAGVALLLIDLLFVRNLFGIAFVAALGVGSLFVAWRWSSEAARLVLVFIATQLAISVFSRADYLFTPTAQTASGPMPSDVAQMAEALFLPYWVWGAACGLFSVAVLTVGVRNYLRP